MNYLTHQLLYAEETDYIKNELEKENQSWEDGKNTAGSHAAEVKNNLQLKRKSDISKKLSLLIKEKILKNTLVKSFTLAKHIQKNLTSNNWIQLNDYDLKKYIELAKSH